MQDFGLVKRLSSSRRRRSDVRRGSQRRCAVETLEARVLFSVSPMSVAEQYMHELVNWVRAHPAEASTRYGVALNAGLPAGTITADPKPPLARNDVLREAMQGHLGDMLAQDYFDHDSLSGTSFVDRIEAAGYSGWEAAGENIAWRGSTGSMGPVFDTVESIVQGWFESAGHRQNMLRPEFREAGSSYAVGEFTWEGVSYNAGMGGQDFGTRTGQVFLTGNGCWQRLTTFDICDVTDPVVGATITAMSASANPLSTTTGPTGEYDLALPPGEWSIVVTGGGIDGSLSLGELSIGTANVKLDFTPDASKPWQNPTDRLDVNNDQMLSPIDALLVINQLNLGGAGTLPKSPVPPVAPPPYVDVNGDGELSPVDVLIVITALNTRPAPEAEFDSGESAAAFALSNGGTLNAAVPTYPIAGVVAVLESNAVDHEPEGDEPTTSTRLNTPANSPSPLGQPTDRWSSPTQYADRGPTESFRRARFGQRHTDLESVDQFYRELATVD